jgi:hypothetical protein
MFLNGVPQSCGMPARCRYVAPQVNRRAVQKKCYGFNLIEAGFNRVQSTERDGKLSNTTRQELFRYFFSGRSVSISPRSWPIALESDSHTVRLGSTMPRKMRFTWT